MDLLSRIIKGWWSINPYLTVIIIAAVVLFIIRVIWAFCSSDSSSSSGRHVSYEEPSQEEVRERKRKAQERREAETALYILQKQRELEKWKRNAHCGHCLRGVPEYDHEAGMPYYDCPIHGRINVGEANNRYCEDYYTLDGPQ